MNSRKIPKELENPFDNIIIELSIKINPLFKYFNFTPNMLTIISLLLGILSAYLIHLQFYNLAALTFITVPKSVCASIGSPNLIFLALSNVISTNLSAILF